MKAVIIETNVIAVANEIADHAGSECILSCINSLEKAKMKQKIVIDISDMHTGQDNLVLEMPSLNGFGIIKPIQNDVRESI